ncbi:ATP-binding protein [Sphaerisporangium aureirubrum]|uniref:histidine kinase n=1 Tax=Sphaerisporangium aureirubrum TaxID=1544736 RepID=A0ABW1NVU1_9ACTN
MRARRPFRSDFLVPFAVGMVQLWGTMGAQHGQVRPGDPGARLPLDELGVVLLLIGPLALTARRTRPVLVLWVNAAVTAVYIWGGYPYGPAFLSPIVSVFNAVLTGHRRMAWLGMGAFYAFFAAYITFVLPAPRDLWHHGSIIACMLVVLTAAEVVGARRERVAERERVEEEEARRRASEERLTMAQELHDVLGHNISLIHVQASTALHLIDEHPEQARTALTTIKQASKDVLTEMRSVLGVLRDDAPRSPTAGVDRLGELIERMPAAILLIEGAPRPLPPGVDRAAYRIVQESLTNVTKHAPGAKATVTLGYGRAELLVRVDDIGRTEPGPLAGAGGGNGVPGMRARAAALGGTLAAVPLPAGFRVEARLPIPAEDTE